MFKRLFTVLAFLSLVLVATPSVPAAAQATTYYREGGHFWAWQGGLPYVGDQQYIDFWAFADITLAPNQPPSRHSMMRVQFHVYWWATGAEYHSNAISTARPARAEGWIKVGGPHGFTIQLPAYYSASSDVIIFTHAL